MFGRVGCFTTLVYKLVKPTNFYHKYLNFVKMKKSATCTNVALKTCEIFLNEHKNKSLIFLQPKIQTLFLLVSDKQLKKFILIFFTSYYLAREKLYYDVPINLELTFLDNKKFIKFCKVF